MYLRTNKKGTCSACLGDNHSMKPVYLYNPTQLLTDSGLPLYDKSYTALYCEHCLKIVGLPELIDSLIKKGVFFNILKRAINNHNQNIKHILLKYSSDLCRLCGDSVEGVNDLVRCEDKNLFFFQHAISSMKQPDLLQYLRVMCRSCYEIILVNHASVITLPMIQDLIYTREGRLLYRLRAEPSFNTIRLLQRTFVQ